MGKYTIYELKWIDDCIRRKIEIAVDEIKKIKGVISVMLTGGFGRGEGSVKIDKNSLRLLNDFDFYAVVEKKVPEQIINNISRKIERKLNSKGYAFQACSAFDFYIDLRALTLSELKRVPPLIKYYEVKHASYVVYGKDFRYLIPDFKIRDLPYSEGVRFLLNRMSHILEWLPLQFFSDKKVQDWQREALSLAIIKIYLEICTALSLIAGFYAPSYLGRLKGFKENYQNKFPDLASKFPELAGDVESFTNLKLKFDLKAIKNLKSEWFKARTYILETSLFYGKKCFGVKNWGDFSPSISKKYLQPYLKAIVKQKVGLKINRIFLSALNYFTQAYLTFFWFFKVAQTAKKIHFPILTSFKDPGLRIFSCLPLLINCIDEDGNIDKHKFKNSVRLLQKVYPVKLKENGDLKNFDNLRKAYINAWKIYYFQKLV